MLCVFGTVIFLLEGSIKRSKAILQIPGWRKNECREIKKKGNANTVVFYAILAHPFPYAISAKKSKHKSHKHKTQISYSKHNVAYRLP